MLADLRHDALLVTADPWAEWSEELRAAGRYTAPDATATAKL